MGRTRSETETGARYAYEGLDRVLHEKARLGILASLLSHPEGLAFNDLKSLCGLTDGNLSRHLRVLEEEGLVIVEKEFDGRKPKTHCRMTARGRQRFLAYLEVLERVVSDALTARRDRSAANFRKGNPERSWEPA
jgi:DNA-binding transcriptional ArsR family regulator